MKEHISMYSQQRNNISENIFTEFEIVGFAFRKWFKILPIWYFVIHTHSFSIIKCEIESNE